MQLLQELMHYIHMVYDFSIGNELVNPGLVALFEEFPDIMDPKEVRPLCDIVNKFNVYILLLTCSSGYLALVNASIVSKGSNLLS